MRNYSESPYLVHELAAVLTGLCKSIGEPSHGITAYIPTMAGKTNLLSLKYNSPVKATGKLDHVGLAIQSLIDTLIKNGVDIDNLKKHIDYELSKLPPSPFVDYFTGAKKGNW